MAKKVRKEKAVQLGFGFMNRGGARKGAGRKPAMRANGMRLHRSHDKREGFDARHPVHVTIRVGPHIPNLRGKLLREKVLGVLEAGNQREDFRIVHFAIMANHLHLICEADSERELSSAIRGLSVRLARAINRARGGHGPVIEDRYHAHVLRSATEVQRAVNYVLRNGVRHNLAPRSLRPGGGAPDVVWIDPLSSAACYDGWLEGPIRGPVADRMRQIVKPAQSRFYITAMEYLKPLSLLAPPPGRRRERRRRGARASVNAPFHF